MALNLTSEFLKKTGVIPSLILESPGKWRVITLMVYVGAMLLPSAWLAFQLASSTGKSAFFDLLSGSFLGAVSRSLVAIFWAVGWSFLIGCPLGIVLGLTRAAWTSIAQVLLAVPLFLPGFIWAIGFSNLRALLPYRFQGWLDGLSGCVLSAVIFTLPLVALTALLAVRSLSRSHADSARIAGGERKVFAMALRYAWPVGLCAAVFGAMLAAADPGPAQIMGYHGASSEVLIALAGRHDLSLAATKAGGLVVALLPLGLLLAWNCAERMDAELSGRDLPHGAAQRRSFYPSGMVTLALIFAIISMPLLGLIIPFRDAPITSALTYAAGVLGQSGKTTLVYGLAAGAIGTTSGAVLALIVGRNVRLRRLALVFCFAFLAFSPAVHALGITMLAAASPTWLDFLTRSGALPVIALGSRFAPVAAIIWMWVVAGLPRSINYAAAIHGLPLMTYLARIIIPRWAAVLLASTVAIGLLSVADVSTLLLLQSPGQTTFAGRVFAVMDNASARTVAALCLVYVVAGCLILWTSAFVLLRRFSQHEPYASAG